MLSAGLVPWNFSLFRVGRHFLHPGFNFVAFHARSLLRYLQLSLSVTNWISSVGGRTLATPRSALTLALCWLPAEMKAVSCRHRKPCIETRFLRKHHVMSLVQAGLLSSSPLFPVCCLDHTLVWWMFVPDWTNCSHLICGLSSYMRIITGHTSAAQTLALHREKENNKEEDLHHMCLNQCCFHGKAPVKNKRWTWSTVLRAPLGAATWSHIVKPVTWAPGLSRAHGLMTNLWSP